MSVRKLFKEYHAEYPDGYQLSSFKRAVRQYNFHVKVVGHVEHYAADQMYIDFAGDRLEVVDEMTGETKKAEVDVYNRQTLSSEQAVNKKPEISDKYIFFIIAKL